MLLILLICWGVSWMVVCEATWFGPLTLSHTDYARFASEYFSSDRSDRCLGKIQFHLVTKLLVDLMLVA